MSKRHSEDVINIPLSTTSILGNKLERVPAGSIRFMLLYHMGKGFVLMPKRKVVREFRGWRGTHENSGSLTIHVGAELYATFSKYAF